ncbi:MAG TPA: DUF4382 domain-containing protein [Arachidicoccus sp.]|nr:DUF4382 domain-containing protein [Arachidicoccus sp.]
MNMFTNVIKSKIQLFTYLACILIVAVVVVSCSKSTDTGGSGTAKMNVYLTDAPGNYKEVWINIQKIMVKSSEDTSSEGWTEMPLIAPGAYNLLDLRNGNDTLLGGVDLPVGKVSQIRLILGDGNKVVLNDGTEVPLATPSAQESGLKLNIDADLVEGVPYELVMDFDASRSIVKAGNSGNYNLKPVIRTFAKATGGAIQGVVLPDSALAIVLAIKGTDTLSAAPDTAGAFKFWGLMDGTYTLSVLPDATTDYQPVTVPNVEVTTGNVNTVDTVWLQK